MATTTEQFRDTLEALLTSDIFDFRDGEVRADYAYYCFAQGDTRRPFGVSSRRCLIDIDVIAGIVPLLHGCDLPEDLDD